MSKMRGTYSERYDGFQIRIERKMLKSGKSQIKFYTYGTSGEDLYGYALVDGQKTLREVVWEIKSKLNKMGNPDSYLQRNLFSFQRDRICEHDFVIFRS